MLRFFVTLPWQASARRYVLPEATRSTLNRVLDLLVSRRMTAVLVADVDTAPAPPVWADEDQEHAFAEAWRKLASACAAHDAVAGFSTLIAGQVELISHVADATLVPGVSPLLVAFLHLVQGKEAAGQERAVGALMYASGLCDEEHQQRLIHLIDGQEHSLKVFAEFADDSLRSRWNDFQICAGTARLERLRRTLCAARPGMGHHQR